VGPRGPGGQIAFFCPKNAFFGQKKAFFGQKKAFFLKVHFKQKCSVTQNKVFQYVQKKICDPIQS